jgi:hypothetical protein
MIKTKYLKGKKERIKCFVLLIYKIINISFIVTKYKLNVACCVSIKLNKIAQLISDSHKYSIHESKIKNDLYSCISSNINKINKIN